MDAGDIRAAEVVLPCEELQATVDFFRGLGFRLERIAPADDPRSATLSGHGLRLRLRRGMEGSPGTLRLACGDPRGGPLTAPNGTRIELAAAEPSVEHPPAAGGVAVARAADARWITGRAGMLYRELIPGRLGGRFGASHIRIPEGGPVSDDVHFHAVRFQVIHCARGWVRLVYEDQGPPFVLEAGETVLQPPRIRHRVLECSPGLEVVELASPAEHETFLDHGLALPTDHARPGRLFEGQRFVRHAAANADRTPWSLPGFVCRDTGVAGATDGIADVRVVQGDGGPARPAPLPHGGGLWFAFLLEGGLTVAWATGEALTLGAGDAVVLPAGDAYTLAARSPAPRFLEVRLPTG